MKLREIFSAIADAIRSHTEKNELIRPDTMPDEISNVFEAGKQSEYNGFWDEFQNYGSLTDYSYAFYNWRSNKIYNPKYSIIGSGTYAADGLFTWYSTLLDTKVDIILKNGCRASATFNNCSSLKTIRYFEVTAESQFINTFDGCNSLEYVTFGGVIGQNGLNLQWSMLSHDSLLTILSCLEDKSTDESGAEWKVTLGSQNLASLSEEEIKIAENKGWSLE